MEMQVLYRMGWPVRLIVEAFRAIAECPWSIMRTEQLHGVGAAQHKAHKFYGADTHSSKTGVRMMLPHVRAASKVEPVFVEEKKIAALKRKAPEKSGGRSKCIGDWANTLWKALGIERIRWLVGKRHDFLCNTVHVPMNRWMRR